MAKYFDTDYRKESYGLKYNHCVGFMNTGRLCERKTDRVCVEEN